MCERWCSIPDRDLSTPAVAKDGANAMSVKWSRNSADLQVTTSPIYEITLRLKVSNVPFTRIPFVVTQVCPLRGAGRSRDRRRHRGMDRASTDALREHQDLECTGRA